MRTDAHGEGNMLFRRPARFTLLIGTDSHQRYRRDLYAGAHGRTA